MLFIISEKKNKHFSGFNYQIFANFCICIQRQIKFWENFGKQVFADVSRKISIFFSFYTDLLTNDVGAIVWIKNISEFDGKIFAKFWVQVSK